MKNFILDIVAAFVGVLLAISLINAISASTDKSECTANQADAKEFGFEIGHYYDIDSTFYIYVGECRTELYGPDDMVMYEGLPIHCLEKAEELNKLINR